MSEAKLKKEAVTAAKLVPRVPLLVVGALLTPGAHRSVARRRVFGEGQGPVG